MSTNRYLFCLLIFLIPFFSSAQKRKSSSVDTLDIVERFSIHTNALDWILFTPNVGIEYDLNNKNWNRWSVSLYGRYNWQTNTDIKTYNVYNIANIKLEVRKYWHTQYRRNSEYSSFFDKLFSPKRLKPRISRSYFYGMYISTDNYSIKFSSEGKQGKAISIGMSYGCIIPLYTYTNKGHIDFEMGISVGGVYTKYYKYKFDSESNCYPVISSIDWKIVPYPVITELKLGFIYRFGVSSKDKYKRRFDIDEKYIMWKSERDYIRNRRKDSLQLLKKENKRLDSLRRDSIKTIKSLLKEQKRIADSLRRDSIKKTKTGLKKEKNNKRSFDKNDATIIHHDVNMKDWNYNSPLLNSQNNAKIPSNNKSINTACLYFKDQETQYHKTIKFITATHKFRNTPN